MPDDAAESRPLIAAHQLRIKIDGKRILHNLDFQIESGTQVGLIGPNGSGKTTLLRTMSGLLRYEGSLTMLGMEVHAWKARALARQMAFVRQATALSFDFKVREMVLLGRAPHKGFLEGDNRVDLERASWALDRVDLAGFSKRSILSLSGGELQRVFLAQALVQDADLLLLDEPTTHLDVHHQYGFLGLVGELVQSGKTSIAVFHDIELAVRYSQYLLVLDKGHLVASGDPLDIVTEQLLASVFSMRTRVEVAASGRLLISYEEPVT